MKMRKKIAALLAAAMIASVMPMSVFADSSNRINKTITVAKDSTIAAKVAPELKIEMKDELTTGLSFYLELEGAEWAPIYTGKMVEEITAVTGSGSGSVATWNNKPVEYEGIYGGLLDKTNDPRSNIVGVSVVTTNEAKVKSDATTDLIKAKAKVKSADYKVGLELSEAFTSKARAVKFDVKTKNGQVVTFEAYRENDTRMAIRLVGDGITSAPFLKDDFMVFPLVAKITGSEAIVKVRKHDTEVSNSEFVFAVSDAAKAKVVVNEDTAPGFYRTTEIADIKLEELYANSVASVDEDKRWFTLELRDPDFTFEVEEGTEDPDGVKSGAWIVGEIAYREYEMALKIDSTDAGSNYKLSRDKTRLAIRIDSVDFNGKKLNEAARERGNFVLKGVKVVADRDAKDGPVKATIESKELFSKELITIAKRGDYKTKLDVPKDWKYEVVAGNEKEVKFTLTEELANSLVGSRPATFTFDQGVKIKTDVSATSKIWAESLADQIVWGERSRYNTIIDEIGKLDVTKSTDAARLVKLQAEIYAMIYGDRFTDYERVVESIIAVNDDIITVEGTDVDAKDKGAWTTQLNRVHIAKDRTSFTVDDFNLVKDKAGKYTFTTTVLVPANVTGDITVAVAGSGVSEEKIKILEAEAPVTVDATGMDIKVGLKEIETTGKLVIKETAKERINQGKNIVLALDDKDFGLNIKSYKATVVEGDLLLDERREDDTDGIRVKRSSTEPSTIEITDIVMTTDRTVPEGKYDLLVGGNALSNITNRLEFREDLKTKRYAAIDPVVTVKSFVNITTKNTEDIAGAGNKAEVKFVVGQGQFLVNGKEVAMDAPAYVKDGRTMVPVRYVATALGVSEEQVTWDGPNQTATIIADKVIQVKLGSKAMLVNSANVPMEVAAELVNDRTFVPIGSIARALGVVVDWDQTNQTVTFNPAK